MTTAHADDEDVTGAHVGRAPGPLPPTLASVSSQPPAVAVLVPVKAFHEAKGRLAAALDAPTRAALAQEMATAVLRASAPLPVYVVCDDDRVAAWASTHAATVLWKPGRGLNGAVNEGVADLSDRGVERVIVAHADLPHALELAWVAEGNGVTLVPDRHDDGTNVAAVPTNSGFTFAYGPASFARHAAEAERLGLGLRVVPRAAPGLGRRRARRPGRSGLGSGVSDPETATPSPLPVGGVPDRTIASVDLAVPARALAIGAHPDDAEFLCGATLAKWAAHGCVINHLVLTDGSKGSWDPDADTAVLAATREDEQWEAARRLGSTGKVVMLGHVDGELEPTLTVRDQVAYWIRALQPEVVLAHDPWKHYRLHPDHRAAGWLALDAVVAARDPHFAPHHDVAAHRPTTVLLFEADQADHVEDVTGFVDAKVDALLAHESQFLTTHGIPADDDGTARETFRRRVHDRAVAVGSTARVGAGEAFKALTDL